MEIREIKEFLKQKRLPAFRLKQVLKAIYTDGVSSFKDISTLSKELREELDENIPILSFEETKVISSSGKKSHKAILKLSDDNYIETVLLQPIPGRWSACVSSQVGCAMGCKFCATGANGFKRNLEVEEITDQILFWKQYIRDNKLEGFFSNIVVMGMGEPFMNYDNMKKALEMFIDPQLFNFAARHISVSTSGIVDGIKRFAKDFPQVNLAVSLIMAEDYKRSKFMPVNNKFDLTELQMALNYYFEQANRKVFLEYIMFEGINDGRNDINDLIDFVKGSARSDLLHVNLIRYNKTSFNFKPSSRETIEWFKNFLNQRGVSTTIRKSLGQEIDAACGQLAGKK